MCFQRLYHNLLLNLVATVCAGKADDKLQFFGGVIDELAL